MRQSVAVKNYFYAIKVLLKRLFYTSLIISYISSVISESCPYQRKHISVPSQPYLQCIAS